MRVQATEDPHNQIIVRVQTCGPSQDRRLCGLYNNSNECRCKILNKYEVRQYSLFSDVTVTLITKYIDIELLERTCLLKNISWLELEKI